MVPQKRSEEEQEREFDGKDSRCKKKGGSTLYLHAAHELLNDICRGRLKSRLDVHLEVDQWNIDISEGCPCNEGNCGQEEEYVVSQDAMEFDETCEDATCCCDQGNPKHDADSNLVLPELKYGQTVCRGKLADLKGFLADFCRFTNC